MAAVDGAVYCYEYLTGGYCPRRLYMCFGSDPMAPDENICPYVHDLSIRRNGPVVDLEGYVTSIDPRRKEHCFEFLTAEIKRLKLLNELTKIMKLPTDVISELSSYAVGCQNPDCIYIHNTQLLEHDLCIDVDTCLDEKYEEDRIFELDTNQGTVRLTSVKMEESVEIIAHNNCQCRYLNGTFNWGGGKKIYGYNNTANSWQCTYCLPKEK